MDHGRIVSDWPSLLVTGLTSGLAGFGGSYLLSRASIRGVEGEMERLKTSHEEDHFRHRQGVYHDYLDALTALANLTTRSKLEPEDMTTWFALYSHRHNAVALFAAGHVTEAARGNVQPIVAQLFQDYDAGRGTVSDRLKRAFDTHGDRLSKARNDLVALMRADVAPDAPA